MKINGFSFPVASAGSIKLSMSGRSEGNRAHKCKSLSLEG